MTTEQWYFYDLNFTALAFELGYNENAKLDEIRWPVWNKNKIGMTWKKSSNMDIAY